MFYTEDAKMHLLQYLRDQGATLEATVQNSEANQIIIKLKVFKKFLLFLLCLLDVAAVIFFPTHRYTLGTKDVFALYWFGGGGHYLRVFFTIFPKKCQEEEEEEKE